MCDSVILVLTCCCRQVLWEKERERERVDTKQSFVDLGCGNGLLVYILSCEGVSPFMLLKNKIPVQTWDNSNSKDYSLQCNSNRR